MSDTRDEGRALGEHPSELIDTVRMQIEAAQDVLNNWSSGDLAGAANRLEEVTDAARETLRELAEDREPVEHRPITPQQAANLLALRGLESETREEMELRHIDEAIFGLTTEELPRDMAARHAAELATLDAREPASYESIKRDPWNAVEQKLPPVSLESIAQDPRNAVRQPLPADAGPVLLSEVAEAVGAVRRELLEDAIGAHPEVVELHHGLADAWKGKQKEAEYRLLQLELAPAVEPDHAPPLFEKRKRDSEFLSVGMAADRGAEYLARTVDLMLETLFGYLVPEPELTPQQAKNLARANEERAEARAVAVEMHRHDAAIAEANWHIGHNLNHARAEDGPRTADNFFDRNPGLTYDGGRDDAGEREIERASYDTGIERGR